MVTWIAPQVVTPPFLSPLLFPVQNHEVRVHLHLNSVSTYWPGERIIELRCHSLVAKSRDGIGYLCQLMCGDLLGRMKDPSDAFDRAWPSGLVCFLSS